MSSDAFERYKRNYIKRQSGGNNNPFIVFLAGIVLIFIGIYLAVSKPSYVQKPNIFGIFFIVFGGTIALIVIGDFIYRKNRRFSMEESTPNDEGMEKMINFWENVDNKTGFFDKLQKTEMLFMTVKKIIFITIGSIILLFGIAAVISDITANRFEFTGFIFMGIGIIILVSAINGRIR